LAIQCGGRDCLGAFARTAPAAGSEAPLSRGIRDRGPSGHRPAAPCHIAQNDVVPSSYLPPGCTLSRSPASVLDDEAALEMALAMAGAAPFSFRVMTLSK
jgi:hypothetical protein